MDDEVFAPALAEIDAAVRRAFEKMQAECTAAYDELREQLINEPASITAESVAAIAEFSSKLSRGDIVGAMVAAREARELATMCSVAATNASIAIGEATTVYETCTEEVSTNQGYPRSVELKHRKR